METLFKGAATALITPFKEDAPDLEALGKIIDFQIDEGIDALVVCGTTGEVSTLSKKERETIIEFTVDRCSGRVPVIAGTGGNNTESAVQMSLFAKKAGADGILSVAPYYNKGTRDGIIQHYRTIAEKCRLPVTVYNVPQRTGVKLTPEMYAELSKIPYINSVKEAGGDASMWLSTVRKCGDRLTLYSGNDSETLQMMSLGAKGVISVASNIIPKRMADMCRARLLGDAEGALGICLECANLFEVLFCEVNPVPVKYAMSKMGFCKNKLRLPLTPCTPETEKRIDAELRRLSLI